MKINLYVIAVKNQLLKKLMVKIKLTLKLIFHKLSSYLVYILWFKKNVYMYNSIPEVDNLCSFLKFHHWRNSKNPYNFSECLNIFQTQSNPSTWKKDQFIESQIIKWQQKRWSFCKPRLILELLFLISDTYFVVFRWNIFMSMHFMYVNASKTVARRLRKCELVLVWLWLFSRI